MGFFSKSTASTRVFPWKNIASVEELLSAFEQPGKKVFFKHSTRCSISSMALRGFEKEWDLERDQPELYFIDLIAHRDVSNKLAELTHVTHQSPQIIVLDHTALIHDASHYKIEATTVQNLL